MMEELNTKTLPKPIKQKILLYVGALNLVGYSKNSKIIKDIINNDYFWKLKLEIDYPQFDHLKYDGHYKLRYERLYEGKTKQFILTKKDTVKIKFSQTETKTYEPSTDNLNKLTKILEKKYKGKYIRGDIILIEKIEGEHDLGNVIFDGTALINLDYTYDNPMPPEEFKVLCEYPILYFNDIFHLGRFYFCKPKIDYDKIQITYDEFPLMYLPIIVNDTPYYLVLEPGDYDNRDIENYDEDFVETLQEKNIGICNREYKLPLPLTDDNTLLISTRY